MAPALIGWMIGAAFVAAPMALADELHIDGGVIEGRVLSESGFVIRLETASGLLDVPTHAVRRRVPGPSRLERYVTEVDQRQGTPQGHIEIARWCESVGLNSRADKHVRAALELDPTFPEARVRAGYVRLGDLWLFAGLSPPPSPTARRTNVMIESLTKGWHRHLRVAFDIQFSRMSTPKKRQKSRWQLLRIKAPLAIAGACRVFNMGGAESRALLAELLGGIDEDEAALNLLAIALFDPDPDVRRAASNQAGRRADDRVIAFLQYALRCQSDALVRRAGSSIGWIGDRVSVEPLIEALSIEGFAGRRVTTQQVLDQLRTTFAAPTVVPIGDQPIEMPPQIRMPRFDRRVQDVVSESTASRGAFRSEIQDALIAITGKNFGFDVEAWREWLAKNPSLEKQFP